MPKISIEHPDLGPQKTYLTAEVDAADTYSLVENNDDFASGDFVLFGGLGEERAEMVTLTGVTNNNTIDHSTGPVFGHPARTPIYQILYNQAQLWRATAEGGTYSLVTTVDLNVDEERTIYNDTGGSETSWYKVRYKNSSATTYSDYTDEVEGGGYTDASLSTLTDSVLEDFGDIDAKGVTRNQVRSYLNSATKKIMWGIIKRYPSFRTAYTTQALTNGTSTYALPSRFLGFKRVDIGTTATTAYKAIFEGEEYGYPDTTYSVYSPIISIRGSNFVLRPSSCTGTAYMWYWDYPAAMDNETDEHGLPYGAEECLVFYGLYRVWLSKNQEKSDRYKGAFDSALEEYLEFVGQQRQMMWKPKVKLMFGTDLYDGF